MPLTSLPPFVPLTATATGRNVQGALNRTGERSRRPCIKSTAASTAARAPPLRRGMPGGYSGVAHPEDGASDRDVIDAAALAAAASSSADAAAVSAFLRWRWRWPWPRRLRPRPPPLTTTEAPAPEAEAVRASKDGATGAAAALRAGCEVVPLATPPWVSMANTSDAAAAEAWCTPAAPPWTRAAPTGDVRAPP